MMTRKQLIFKAHGDKSLGYVSYFESNRDIPFTIRRVYYTYNVPLNSKRGMHAHKKLEQVLWCPYGSIEVVLDDGINDRETYSLNSPDMALLVGDGVWRELYWRKAGSVLCVAASEYYDENDYIRDYDEFLKYVKEGFWENED